MRTPRHSSYWVDPAVGLGRKGRENGRETYCGRTYKLAKVHDELLVPVVLGLYAMRVAIVKLHGSG